MLLIEFILTVRAWSSGWKRVALLPLAIAFPVGVLGQAALGRNPADLMGGFGFGIIIDALALAALIVMNIIRPKPE
jgi:hypothetical protein